MKAAVYYESGPPSVFRYEDVPDPKMEARDLLVRISIDQAINYATHDLVAEVRRLTDNRGVDLVVDPVGGSTLQKSILSLAYRRRVSFVGRAGREAGTVDVSTLMRGNQSLSGIFLGAEMGTERVRANIQRHIDAVARGELKVVIDRTFPLKDAAVAHEYIESRKAVGRVLLIP